MFYNFGAKRNLSHINLNFIKLKAHISILRKPEYILILLTINYNQIVKYIPSSKYKFIKHL